MLIGGKEVNSSLVNLSSREATQVNRLLELSTSHCVLSSITTQWIDRYSFREWCSFRFFRLNKQLRQVSLSYQSIQTHQLSKLLSRATTDLAIDLDLLEGTLLRGP